MSCFGAVAVVLLFAGRLYAQPGIGQNGVVNSASQIPSTLPGGPLARGALIRIHGIKFSSGSGTSVTLVHNETSLRLPLVSAAATLIEARIPRQAPLGASSLIVTVDGKPSRPFPVEVAASNPGIFALNGEGWGPGRIWNIAASGARSANSTSHPALRGQRVVLETTGLGDAKEVTVAIGNREAKASLPRATARPGEEEITVQIPNDAPLGCYVPAFIEVTPTRASNVVTLSIHAPKQTCDVEPIHGLDWNGVAIVALTRMQTKALRLHAPDLIEDNARVTFIGNSTLPVVSPLPPAGTCIAYINSLQAYTKSPTTIGSVLSGVGLSSTEDYAVLGIDGGPELRLSRQGESRVIGAGGTLGRYRAVLGGRGTGPEPAPFLDPGTFELEVPGGDFLKPFRAVIPGPPAFEWTDREQISLVDRQHPPTLHWSSARGRMFIIASNVDQITTASSACVCAARAGDGQFTIPAALLGNVPASQDIPGVPYDRLDVVSVEVTKLKGIESAGLSGAVSVGVYSLGRNVKYR